MAERGHVILGIDPGTASTGYGLVEQRGNRLSAADWGVIQTGTDRSPAERLREIFDELNLLLARHQPDVAAVESLYFNVNVRTALAVGQARGVVILACALAPCAVYEYTPQQVKQAVVGYGKAEKLQVQEMVRVLLRLATPPCPDHAADALGVAICHAHSRGVREGVERKTGAERGGAVGDPRWPTTRAHGPQRRNVQGARRGSTP